MINIERIKVENFVATIIGNGGEEELVIMSSPLRGNTSIGAMATSVLGPVRMIRIPAMAQCPEQDIYYTIIAQWCTGRPDDEAAWKQAREAAILLERAWEDGVNVESIWPRAKRG